MKKMTFHPALEGTYDFNQQRRVGKRTYLCSSVEKKQDGWFAESPEVCCDWYLFKELECYQIVNFGLNPILECYVIQSSVCFWQDPQNPLPNHLPEPYNSNNLPRQSAVQIIPCFTSLFMSVSRGSKSQVIRHFWMPFHTAEHIS